MQLQVLHEDSALRIGAVGPLLMISWSDVPSLAQVQQLSSVETSYREGAGCAKLVVVNLILGGSLDNVPRFTDEVRTEAARHIRRQAPWRAGAAHVIRLTGMRGVAVRAFLNTVVLVASPSAPTRVFADLDTAAPWLAPLLPGDPWTAAQVLAALQQVAEM